MAAKMVNPRFFQLKSNRYLKKSPCCHYVKLYAYNQIVRFCTNETLLIRTTLSFKLLLSDKNHSRKTTFRFRFTAIFVGFFSLLIYVAQHEREQSISRQGCTKYYHVTMTSVNLSWRVYIQSHSPAWWVWISKNLQILNDIRHLTGE